jgi:hypothetical protein
MDATATPTKKLARMALLSNLWIVVAMNIILADVLSLYIPGASDAVAATAGETPIPQLMLAGAIGVEVSVAMVILSRVLKQAVNRWVNIVAGVFTIMFVWGAAAPYPHYTFLAAVETVCLLLVIWNAWKWTASEG